MATTYCTTYDVADFLRIPITANTTPNKAQVEKIINRKEAEVDRRTGHAWRSTKVTREVHDLPLLYTFGWGTPIFLQHRNIYELDASKGDKIEIWQGASATWENILGNEQWYECINPKSRRNIKKQVENLAKSPTSGLSKGKWS